MGELNKVLPVVFLHTNVGVGVDIMFPKIVSGWNGHTEGQSDMWMLY